MDDYNCENEQFERETYPDEESDEDEWCDTKSDTKSETKSVTFLDGSDSFCMGKDYNARMSCKWPYGNKNPADCAENERSQDVCEESKLCAQRKEKRDKCGSSHGSSVCSDKGVKRKKMCNDLNETKYNKALNKDDTCDRRKCSASEIRSESDEDSLRSDSDPNLSRCSKPSIGSKNLTPSKTDLRSDSSDANSKSSEISMCPQNCTPFRTDSRCADKRVRSKHCSDSTRCGKDKCRKSCPKNGKKSSPRKDVCGKRSPGSTKSKRDCCKKDSSYKKSFLSYFGIKPCPDTFYSQPSSGLCSQPGSSRRSPCEMSTQAGRKRHTNLAIMTQTELVAFEKCCNTRNKGGITMDTQTTASSASLANDAEICRNKSATDICQFRSTEKIQSVKSILENSPTDASSLTTNDSQSQGCCFYCGSQTTNDLKNVEPIAGSPMRCQNVQMCRNPRCKLRRTGPGQERMSADWPKAVETGTIAGQPVQYINFPERFDYNNCRDKRAVRDVFYVGCDASCHWYPRRRGGSDRCTESPECSKSKSTQTLKADGTPPRRFKLSKKCSRRASKTSVCSKELKNNFPSKEYCNSVSQNSTSDKLQKPVSKESKSTVTPIESGCPGIDKPETPPKATSKPSKCASAKKNASSKLDPKTPTSSKTAPKSLEKSTCTPQCFNDFYAKVFASIRDSQNASPYNASNYVASSPAPQKSQAETKPPQPQKCGRPCKDKATSTLDDTVEKRTEDMPCGGPCGKTRKPATVDGS